MIIDVKTGEAVATIYFDIETFGGEKPSLDSITPDGRLQDPVKIEADLLKKQEEAWRDQALNSAKGIVWCIGIAVNDNPPVCWHEDDERATLNRLVGHLDNHPYAKIVAHNGYDFDFLWMFRKGLQYEIGPLVGTFGYRTPTLVDTLELMKGTARYSPRAKISLDDMAKLFGFSGKGDMDGSMVHDAVINGEHEKIINYCKADVNLLRKCYRRLNGLGVYPQ